MNALRVSLLAVASVLAAGVVACASSGETKTEQGPAAEPWDPRMLQSQDTKGMALTNIDTNLKAWNNLVLTARGENERRTAALLEEGLEYSSREHRAMLLEELETGPPYNRQVAAMALGFTRDPAVLSPLLAALDDPTPEVASNALLGIGILAWPDTPLGGAAHILETHPDERLRSNAAWCIRHILQAGGEGTVALRAAQHGLHDEDPSVRAQCALIVAHLMDLESLATLSLLLFDDVNVAASAASRALAYIAVKDAHVKGQCARALAASLEKVNPTVRRAVLQNLQLLAQKNYGDDAEAWVAWAHRLP